MADPTLSRGATNFETSGSLVLTLYNTFTESIKKSANLIPFNMPTKDSDETIAFDMLGVTRDITIRGKFTTDDNADIWKFADDLDSLIDGNQGDTGAAKVGYTYTPVSLNFGSSGATDRNDTEGYSTKTLNVYVNDASYDFVQGEPSTLSFSLSLIEQSATYSA